MPSILEKKLRTKKEEIKQIDQKVEAEQIKPTSNEKENISDIIGAISQKFHQELSDPSIDKEELNGRIVKAIHEEIDRMPGDYETKKRLEKLAVSNIIGLGPLQQYLDNPEITEVIVQRYDNICVEKKGKIFSTKASFSDEESLKNIINRILQPVGREVSLKVPIVDAYLEDSKSRVCATIPPASPAGATLTIRKFNNSMMTVEKYLELRSLSPKMMQFLKLCVEGKVSIFVSGGTGTGKTTFLNMLSGFLPNDELIITIEDTLELQLKQKNVRSLQTRQNNSESMMPVTMSSLVKASLRMRPDIIVVGEVRDGAVVSLMSAMSTGHEGSMSTGHANSPENLVNVRIPIMIGMDESSHFSEQAQAMMISESLQLIVQLRRLPDGRRIVSQITEVGGIDRNGRVILKDIFQYDYHEDKFVFTGFIPKKTIDHMGYYGVNMDESFFTA